MKGQLKRGAGAPLWVRRAAFAALAGVLLAELVDAAAGVDDLLLARIEGVAVRADLDLQVVAQGRARVEGVPAAAGHGDLFVLGMDSVFHGLSALCAACRKKARSVAMQVSASKKKSAEKPFGRQRRRYPCGYPQKVWISVWMTQVLATVHRYKIVTSSNWSLFHQSFLTCALNYLRAAAEVSPVKRSSTHGFVARRAIVCITPARNRCARTAAAEKFVRPFTNLHASVQIGRGTFATRRSLPPSALRPSAPAGRGPAGRSRTAGPAPSHATARVPPPAAVACAALRRSRVRSFRTRDRCALRSRPRRNPRSSAARSTCIRTADRGSRPQIDRWCA